MFTKLHKRLSRFKDAILDSTIKVADAQVDLCERYGYGYTVTYKRAVYYFHLPHVRHDEEQLSMLRSGTFPQLDTLRRIQRRTKSGLTIVQVGARMVPSLFFAGPMQADAVHALAADHAELAVIRKNATLNECESRVHPQWFDCDPDTADAASPALSLDHYFAGERLAALDLLCLDLKGRELTILHGANDLLERFGPAVFLWNPGEKRNAIVDAVSDMLQGRGYGDAEHWSGGHTFWVNRI